MYECMRCMRCMRCIARQASRDRACVLYNAIHPKIHRNTPTFSTAISTANRVPSQRTRLVTRVSRHSRGRPVTGCVTSYLGEQLSTGWLTLSSDALRFGPSRSSQRSAPQRCWQTHPAFCCFTRSATPQEQACMVDAACRPISRVSGNERFDRLVDAKLCHASCQRGSRESREAPRCTNMSRNTCENEYRICENYLSAIADSMGTCGAGSRGP